MAGVRKQGRGVADIAVDCLGHDQRGVERNADRERLAETGGRVDMRVARTMIVTVIVTVILAMIMVMMAVMVVATHL
jgi:hypothetical protein